MHDSTLAALQALKSTEFHSLCDELLPRLSPRYFPLVPHGRNDRGDSIRGQPDSYVGDSAATCRIAIQHTVQRESWWTKVIDDVRDAKTACPQAAEIVTIVPRDIDRERPKKSHGVTWLDDARNAAAPATLTVYHGRLLANALDAACQDLRKLYLGIPYSRLAWHTLITACHESSVGTVNRLRQLGRFDPDAYVDRDADDQLFEFWQECLRNATGRSATRERRILVPLIADSGIGKTSLLSRFVTRTLPHSPVLLLVARDLSFDQDDSLLRNVLERVQGSIAATARTIEEAHVAALLNGKTPLTVVLDGLDETTNIEGVRRSIDGWLRSRLGKGSVLIVSSRPEFWRNCRDATWANTILHERGHPKSAKVLRHEQHVSALDPMQGIKLPGLFSTSDVLNVWRRANRDEAEFWLLPSDVRREFAHPFTLRSALELLRSGTNINALRNRIAIMTLWIKVALHGVGKTGAAARRLIC